MLSAFYAARLCTPLEVIEDACLLVRDGAIEAVGTRAAVAAPSGAKPVELGDAWIAPGLLDIHVHGGAGHDVMRNDQAGRQAMEQQMARTGVTAYLATTVTAPWDATLASLEHLGGAVAAAAAASGGDARRARPLGIHLEGPFLSHARRGVHPPEHLVSPSPDKLDQMWQAAQGTVRLLTIAPEVPGAMETIHHARQLAFERAPAIAHLDFQPAQLITPRRHARRANPVGH